MITKNKLAGHSNTQTSHNFTPPTEEPTSIRYGENQDKNSSANKNHKSARRNSNRGGLIKFIFLLIGILLIVAGATFGIIYLFKNNINNDPPANEIPSIDEAAATDKEVEEQVEEETEDVAPINNEELLSTMPITDIESNNPTIKYGRLMLINPNYMVDSNFINARKNELISLNDTYGIKEYHTYNGDNLLDKEAAEHLKQMLDDYAAAFPGHELMTVSCFRPKGTSCGRLCMPTGASDHHTGLTCDLIDPTYGDSLDTSTLTQHLEWQWLKENSYKYGFIDRFPEAWAGGSMEEPMNLTAEGSTGLYETWHYRYVGEYAANQIASGVYNNGEYDSLEHYLLRRGLVTNLLNGN